MKRGNLRRQSLDVIILMKMLRWLIIFKISLRMLTRLRKTVVFILVIIHKKMWKIKTEDEDDKKDAYITKHFDFRLDGNINGNESSRTNDFAYAYFRDEIKGKVNKGEKCNPDINIEQKWGNGSGEENQSNPHWNFMQTRK